MVKGQCRCPLPSENKQGGRKSGFYIGQGSSCWCVLTDTAGDVVLNRLKFTGSVLSTHKQKNKYQMSSHNPIRYPTVLLCPNFSTQLSDSSSTAATGIPFILNVVCFFIYIFYFFFLMTEFIDSACFLLWTLLS